MQNKVLIIIFLVHSFFITKAQFVREFIPDLYFTPSVTIGYTIRSGWNFGINITLGIAKLEHILPKTSAAINIQYYFISYKSEYHKVTTINFVADNIFTQFGIGLGMVSKSWGYKRVNSDFAFGLSSLFSLNPGNYKYPWFGIKTLIPTANWTWTKLPYYISFYTYWQQEPILLQEN